MEKSIRPFFEPAGIVVVGASHQPEKLGYGVARNLIESGYPGEVHFVNLKGGELFGKNIYQSIGEVPDPVELAVILIPANLVPQTVAACGERGIKAAIIASGGFREVGAEGEKLEEEVLRIAKERNIRIIGPNCIGMLNTNYPLDTTFLPPPLPEAGAIAFVSHSGALCAAVIDWAKGEGFGFSHLISLGNQLDIGEADVLEPLAEDKNTKVITMYLEGVKDGGQFTQRVKDAAQIKPVIAIKVGRFESGQKAASSHTGAMAGTDAAFDTVFRKAGVIRANTTEEMFEWAKALAWSKDIKGNRIAILTNAGGPGVTAADALEVEGLSLAEFQVSTQKKLSSLLPPAASTVNPVDMLASASPDDYGKCLGYLLEDKNVDGVVVISPPPPMFKSEDVADQIIDQVKSAKKPVLVSFMGSELVEGGIEKLRKAKIPEFGFPERAVSAMGVLWQRARINQTKGFKPIKVDYVDRSMGEKILNEASSKVGGFLDEIQAITLLEGYGIPVLPMGVARSSVEVVGLSRKIGYPVVMKVAAKSISHKTDVGGVLVNLKTEEEVLRGYQQIKENIKNIGSVMEGVYIQAMAMPGQEVIVGAVRDPQFGPLLMFGSGGVDVEGLGDVGFAIAPLSDMDFDYLLANTWAGKKLSGYRGIPPGDKGAVKDILARLGQLMLDFPQILEVEINPLRVCDAGKGAAALDIRLKFS